MATPTIYHSLTQREDETGLEVRMAAPEVTRKLIIAPLSDKSLPCYYGLLKELTPTEAIFDENPYGFRLDLAKRNPLFRGGLEHLRQGDVILKRVNNLDLSGYAPTRTCVVTESVATKNTHEFIDGRVHILGRDIQSGRNKEKTREFVIVVDSEFALLGHKDVVKGQKKAHALHVVKQGCYEVHFQQVYHGQGIVKRVID